MNTAQVGTLETNPEIMNALDMIASNSRLMFFPNLRSNAASIRLESGSVVYAAEIPNDAITKIITGFATPDTATPSVGATPNTGISPIYKRQIIKVLNGAVTSITMNDISMPMVLIPVAVSPSIAGIKFMVTKIKTAITMPASCFGFKVYVLLALYAGTRGTMRTVRSLYVNRLFVKPRRRSTGIRQM